MFFHHATIQIAGITNANTVNCHVNTFSSQINTGLGWSVVTGQSHSNVGSLPGLGRANIHVLNCDENVFLNITISGTTFNTNEAHRASKYLGKTPIILVLKW